MIARWNSPLAARHRHQHGHLPPAARLPEDGDPAGIASERRDVVAHPLERGHDVEHPDAARRREIIAGQLRQVGGPEDVEAVIDRHHHHVARGAQVDAVVGGRGSGSGAEASAVQPDHDRAPPAVARSRRPDIEEQAVLARDRVGAALRRRGAVLQGLAHAGPRGRGDRRHEPVLPACWGAVAHPLEDVDARPHRAADTARGGLDRRARRGVLAEERRDQRRKAAEQLLGRARGGESREPPQECSAAPRTRVLRRPPAVRTWGHVRTSSCPHCDDRIAHPITSSNRAPTCGSRRWLPIQILYRRSVQSTIASCTVAWSSAAVGAFFPRTLNEWSPPATTKSSAARQPPSTGRS